MDYSITRDNEDDIVRLHVEGDVDETDGPLLGRVLMEHRRTTSGRFLADFRAATVRQTPVALFLNVSERSAPALAGDGGHVDDFTALTLRAQALRDSRALGPLRGSRVATPCLGSLGSGSAKCPKLR